MGMLDGKVVVVTGAARGQGRAHAVTSAREGADVVLVDLASTLPTTEYAGATEDDLARTAAEVEAHGRGALPVVADVRRQDQLDDAVASALSRFGRIDVMIANAGLWARGRFWELDEGQWDEMISVNLTGVWKSVKAVAPHMISRRSGSVVLTSSSNGLEGGMQWAHYAAAKHGVIGLMRSFALELGPYGVRCNAVCPGSVRSPMTDHQRAWDMYAGHEGGTREDMDRAGSAFAALAGVGFLPPQAVADTVLYLNSDLAAAVTGAAVPVDAGHMALVGLNPAQFGDL